MAGRGGDRSPARPQRRRPSLLDFERFRRVVELVRERCDVILNLSSSGLSGATGERRMRPLAELIRRWPLPMRIHRSRRPGLCQASGLSSVSCRRHGATGQARDRSVRAGFHQHRPRPCQAGLAATSLHFQFVLGGVARCSRHPQVSASRSRVSARRFDLLGYRGGEGTVSHGGHGHRHGRAHELSRAKCIGGRKNSAKNGGTS